LDETIWSLTSPRGKRISGSENFRSPPQKDFCNNIRQKRSFYHVVSASKYADGISRPNALAAEAPQPEKFQQDMIELQAVGAAPSTPPVRPEGVSHVSTSRPHDYGTSPERRGPPNATWNKRPEIP
jgi:hypothetical protein